MRQIKFQKIIVLSVVSVSFALGNTFAVAQETQQPQNAPRHFEHSPEEMLKMRMHHLQNLHDRLKITASQESVWQSFQDAFLPPKDQKRPPKPKDDTLLTAPEKIEQHLAFIQHQETRLQTQLEQTKALYAQLNAEQQAILNKDEIFRPFPGFRPRLPHHGEPGKDKK